MQIGFLPRAEGDSIPGTFRARAPCDGATLNSQVGREAWSGLLHQQCPNRAKLPHRQLSMEWVHA